MSLESLDAVENSEPVVQEPSNPVEEVKEEPAENDTDAEPEKVEEEEKREPTEAEKTKMAMQRRIDKQTAKYRRLEEKRMQDKAEKESLEQELAKFRQDDGDGLPNLDDFKSYEEYEDALVEAKAEKRINERLEAEKLERLQEVERKEAEALKKHFDESVSAFKAQRPDYSEKEAIFKEVVDDLVSVHGNNKTLEGLGSFILDSEVSPAIIYEFGENPELAEEIASLPPLKALRELFELEKTVKNRKPEKAVKQPKPIKPINATGKGSKKLDDMSVEEVMAHFKRK